MILFNQSVLRQTSSSRNFGERKKRKLNQEQSNSNSTNNSLEFTNKNNENSLKIGVQDIHDAYHDLFSLEEFPLGSLPMKEKLFLISIYQAHKTTKDIYVPMENVVNRVQTYQVSLNLRPLTFSQLLPSLNMLLHVKLIEFKESFDCRFPKIRLLVGDADILSSLSTLMEEIKL
jgi:hypothetical protein